MRLSKHKIPEPAEIERAIELATQEMQVHPESLAAVAVLFLADVRDKLTYENIASQRREKRLKRQVELMGWLIGSHEADVYALSGYAVKFGGPTFDQMGDPSDEGEYTDDDLDMLKDHWPAAAEELLRRQMAADNPGGRDAEAEHTWRNR